MLSNMAASLITHKRIFTTTAKAKALKLVVEPLITKSKDDSTASRRHVFSILQNKEAVTELFKTIAPKVGDRPGGYTRIIKLGSRKGDKAPIVIMELVTEPVQPKGEAKPAKKAATRKAAPRKVDAEAEAEEAVESLKASEEAAAAVDAAEEVRTAEAAGDAETAAVESAEEAVEAVEASEEAAAAVEAKAEKAE